ALALGAVPLGHPHPRLRGAGGLALLVSTAGSLAGGLQLRGGGEGLEVLAEADAGDIAVLLPRTGLLAAHLVAAGEMLQIDAGGGFVDFLPAAPGAENKALLEILFADPEALHAFGEGFHVVKGG